MYPCPVIHPCPMQNIMKLGINKREALEVPEAEKPSIM